MSPHRKTGSKSASSGHYDRRGATIPILAVIAILFFVMAALSIDIAYIQVIKAQLRAATDSAAKAAATSLIQGQTTQTAEEMAWIMGLVNPVGPNYSLWLDSSDIVFGQASQNSDGTASFVPGATPYSAVQVTGRLTNASFNGSIPLFFGPFVGVSAYSTTNTSVAAVSAIDVCLVLDRSHSMCWDNSGTKHMYPPPINYDPTDSTGLKYPPLPGSRWESLKVAVQSFCDVVSQNSNGTTQVGVVTWSSDVTTSSPEYTLTGQTSPAQTYDQALTTNMASVTNALAGYSNNLMLGGTDMTDGLAAGYNWLYGPNSRPGAKKIMILMTDGQWNVRGDPTYTAECIGWQNVIIHAVSFSQNADQSTCRAIAYYGNGQFYYASDTSGLIAAFTQIASKLPIALIK